MHHSAVFNNNIIICKNMGIKKGFDFAHNLSKTI